MRFVALTSPPFRGCPPPLGTCVDSAYVIIVRVRANVTSALLSRTFVTRRYHAVTRTSATTTLFTPYAYVYNNYAVHAVPVVRQTSHIS
ncbi:hypothetical protein JZ785_19755 [Alicyclobacillus curvatus]|nr:hypothetical protein JZ785_19755 [Alicyclobacillus curvatus]